MEADEARTEAAERLRAKTRELQPAASDKDAARLRALDRLKERTREQERAKAQLAEQERLAAAVAKAAAEEAEAEAQAHDAEAKRMREQAEEQRLRAKREEALIAQIARAREELEEQNRQKAAAANARMEIARKLMEQQRRYEAEQLEERRRHDENMERSREEEERRHREEEQRFREEEEARRREERQQRRREEEEAKEEEKNARLRAKQAQERARSRSAHASRAQARAAEGRAVLRARSKSVKTHREKAAALQAEVVALRDKMRERSDNRKTRDAERLRAKEKCTTFVDIDSSDDEAFVAWEAVSAEVKDLEIRYLETADLVRDYQDAQDSGYEDRMAALLADSKRARGPTWMDARRSLYGERARALQARRKAQTEADLAHANAVRAAIAKVAASSQGDKAADSVELSEFTQKALERLRAKEEEEADDARAAAASSQGDAGRNDAKLKYDSFFLKDSGRASTLGGLGAWSADPIVTPEQKSWDDDKWALRFLWLGGFEPSTGGANDVDQHGWLAVHYAIQCMVFWSKAVCVVRGLVDMMDEERLRAKIPPESRCPGYSALHLCAHGSDRLRQRWRVAELLLHRRCEVNSVDANQRTPLLLAAGTGVVDVARVLVEARADLTARDRNGKNAMDKAVASSGSMCAFLPAPSPTKHPRLFKPGTVLWTCEVAIHNLH